jgi:hypothetical protein
MKSLQTSLLALSMGAAASVCIAGGDGASKLRNDPFDQHRTNRPDLRPQPTAATPQAWRPELRAVLLAGDRSMADVGGIIVKLGGEVDGFRLLEVRDRKAVFVKNGARLTLSIDRNKEP